MSKFAEYFARQSAKGDDEHNYAMSTRVRPILYLFILSVSCISAHSAITDEFRRLTTADGLSDLLVNAIYKDSTGYLWFGTELALDRFDGNHIKTYSFPGTTNESRRVNAITEVSRGQLFVGNQNGLWQLDQKSQTLVPVLGDKIKFPVKSLANDGRNQLYAGTRQGLIIYDLNTNKSQHILLHPDALSADNEISGLWYDGQGVLWMSTAHAVHRLNLADGNIERLPLPPNSPITRMAYDRGMLYLGTHGGGVVPLDISTRQFHSPILTGNNIISSLSPDGQGRLYISTDGEGIYLYSIDRSCTEAQLTTSSTSPMVLRSNSVYSTLIDDKGLLWVGYYQGGVDYTPYIKGYFSTYKVNGLFDSRHYPVRAIAISQDHKVIGTREGLFYVDERAARVRKFTKPEIKSNVIFCITPVGGRYYIGTYGGGMYTLDPSTLSLKVFAGSGALVGGDVFNITPDRQGRLWVGTSDGLYLIENDKVTARYTHLNSQLPEGNIYEIYFDSTGRGWVCTEHGMATIDGNDIHSGRFPAGFFDKLKIRDVFESSDHRLYFAPDRGDLMQSNLQLTEYGPVNFGMENPMKMTTFVTEDPDGWLLFGSENGLYRYDKHGNLRQFNNADGIPNEVFTLCPPVSDSNGNIWLGNSDGLIKYDFRKFKAESTARNHKISISDLLVDNNSLADRLTASAGIPPAITIAKDQNSLTVMLANPDYIQPQYQYIEYRLEGVDSTWRRTDGLTPIRYDNIPAGRYVLSVRRPGEPGSEQQLLELTKEAGFNWLLLVLVALSVLSIVSVIYIVVELRRKKSASSEQAMAQEIMSGTVPHYKTSSLSDEECRRILKLLNSLMKSGRPFTNPELKSAELAAMAGTTSHALSYVFNQYLDKSFYDYVNEYRVDEFKRLVAANDSSRYTLSAMAEMCGFSSRASFFRHFKAITGETPAAYIKRTKES